MTAPRSAHPAPLTAAEIEGIRAWRHSGGALQPHETDRLCVSHELLRSQLEQAQRERDDFKRTMEFHQATLRETLDQRDEAQRECAEAKAEIVGATESHAETFRALHAARAEAARLREVLELSPCRCTWGGGTKGVPVRTFHCARCAALSTPPAQEGKP